MNDKTLVIITGQLAAGKTSYGRKIAETLKLPFFSKDLIKEILYDSVCSDEVDYEVKRKIGASSYKVLYYIVEELMKVSKTMIIESNFSKESVPIIKNLLDKYCYNSATIRFVGNLEVLHKRFLEREKSSKRHSALMSNGLFDDFEEFKKASLKAEEFKIDGKEIVVDTTDFSKVDLNNIIREL